MTDEKLLEIEQHLKKALIILENVSPVQPPYIFYKTRDEVLIAVKNILDIVDSDKMERWGIKRDRREI